MNEFISCYVCSVEIFTVCLHTVVLHTSYYCLWINTHIPHIQHSQVNYIRRIYKKICKNMFCVRCLSLLGKTHFLNSRHQSGWLLGSFTYGSVV